MALDPCAGSEREWFGGYGETDRALGRGKASGFGEIFLKEARERKKLLLQIGLVVSISFLFVRGINFYGDPHPWSLQKNLIFTIMSFLNCEKYPPSLLYLSMTLGPALMLLGGIRETTGRLSRAVVTLGRVPFFLYVVHLFLLHAIAVVMAQLCFGDAIWLFRGLPILSKPGNYGVSLPGVYTLWIAVVLMLYPLAHWFEALKQRRHDWWLSYL